LKKYAIKFVSNKALFAEGHFLEKIYRPYLMDKGIMTQIIPIIFQKENLPYLIGPYKAQYYDRT
jgi:hypothetical protein